MALEFKNVSWDALEYEHKEKNNDWFWALGIITGAVSITSIIYKSYFFATLIIIAALTLTLFSKRKPEMIHFELEREGFKINNGFYPYKKLKAFWIDTSADNHQLLLMSDRTVVPLLSIPVPKEEALVQDIRSTLLNFVKEEEMHEPITHRLLEYFGF